MAGRPLSRSSARIAARVWRGLVGPALMATLLLATPAPAAPRTQSGVLADGTPYRMDLPDNWNGALLLDLDYVTRPDPTADPRYSLLLSRGYAVGGVSRAKTGWAVPSSVDNLIATLGLFETAYGKPKWAIAFGGSLGGHTAATAVNIHSDRFVGAMAMCSSPAGAVAIWNGKLDALFVAKTLLAPKSDLPTVDVPADFATTSLPAWQAVLKAAQATPQGRARIALAAVLGQLPTWSNPAKPEPAASDIAAQEDGLFDSLSAGPLPVVAQAMSSRRQITTLAGGNVSWTTGVDYRAALARLPERSLVAALYRQAGLSLDRDLDALARAPRIAASPKAIGYLAPQVFDGDLKVPVLTLNATGDQIASVAATEAYAAQVRAAGRGAMLRQVYTESAGHCAFSPAEVAAAADTLKARLETGKWPDTSPPAMSARAKAIGAGPVRFVAYQPDPFLRPFSVADSRRVKREADRGETTAH
jgi:pimeloyl-ACP methyl ester carboxylesterase